jgi:hypothetical protein
MSRIDELRQQIDACRTGSDDLHLPELSELAQSIGQDGVAKSGAVDANVAREFDRSQRFDRNVGSALHDVSVPAGLLEKLLAKTATAGSDSAAPTTLGTMVAAAANLSAEVSPNGTAKVAAVNRGISRRGWALSLGAAGLIAASIVALAFVLWPASRQQISLEQLAADVPQWNGSVKPPDGWQNNPPATVLGAYPVESLRRGKSAVVKWRSFRTARGEGGVVYDVTPRGGATVRLFVVATPHRYAVALAPPPTTLPGVTGGCSAGAWQRSSSGLLYVLVVEQGGVRLDDYLRSDPVG